MADISHDELLQSLGDTAASFTKKVANEAANFTCGLYRQYPWALTFGDWGNYKKGFWDQMCSQRPGGLPLPPSAPFKGGQCGVNYYVYVNRNYTIPGDQFNPPQTINENGYAQNILGPVRGIYNSAPPNQQQRQYIQCATGDVSYGGLPPNYILNSVTITSVNRMDNGADNCGDLPSEYPKTPVPDSARSTTISVTLSDNSVVNVPVTFQPITNKYEVNLKAGDLSLDFDLGGVHINRNSVDFNTLNTQVSNITNNVSNLAQNFAAYYNSSTAYSSSFNLFPFSTKSDSGSSKPPDEEASDNLAYVTVYLTKYPSNARTQEGERAQDVMYAGWFQFASEGFYYPREPIHFVKSIFKAPPGATSFAYTLYHGFEANVVEHRTGE